MPRSKRRPKAAAKARGRARYQLRHADDLLVPPWQVWLEASQDSAVDAEMLRLVEHLRFRVNEGPWTSLADMAAEAGKPVAELVEGQSAMESLGYLAWDVARQSIVITVPATAE